MFHAFGRAETQAGDSLANWQVEVVTLGDDPTVIPIFADENGTPIETNSGVENRALADDLGNYDFFVPSGTYSLRFYDAAGEFQKTQRYLPMYGAATPEIEEARDAAAASKDAAAASAAEAEGYAANLATASRYSLSIIMQGQSNAKARGDLVSGAVSPKLTMFEGGEEYDGFATYTGNDTHWQNVGANMGSLVAFSPSNPENGEGYAQGLSQVLAADALCTQINYISVADGSRHARTTLYYHQGSGRYTNYVSAVQQSAKLLPNTVVPVNILAQFEADADTSAPGGGSSESPVSQAQFFQIMKDYRDRNRFHWSAVLGDRGATIPLYVVPAVSQVYPGTNAVQDSYYDAIDDGGIVILPPWYQFYTYMDTSGIHIESQGKRYYAELIGYVNQRILRGQTYQPVRVTSAQIVGGTVELTFATPDNSDLVIDTTTFVTDDFNDAGVNATELYGLRFFDTSAGAYVAINSITATGRKLILTPSVTPVAGDRWEIARQPWPGGTTPPTGTFGTNNTPRSNIRCGLSHTAADGTELYHYALPAGGTL